MYGIWFSSQPQNTTPILSLPWYVREPTTINVKTPAVDGNSMYKTVITYTWITPPSIDKTRLLHTRTISSERVAQSCLRLLNLVKIAYCGAQTS